MGQRNVGEVEADGPVLVDEYLVLAPQNSLLEGLRAHVLGLELLLPLELGQDGPFSQDPTGLIEFLGDVDRNLFGLAYRQGVPAAGAAVIDAMLPADLALPDPQLHGYVPLSGRLLHQPLRSPVHADREYGVRGGLGRTVLGLLRPGHPRSDPGHRTGVDLHAGAPGHRFHDFGAFQGG